MAQHKNQDENKTPARPRRTARPFRTHAVRLTLAFGILAAASAGARSQPSTATPSGANSSGGARVEYRLNAGDVLEISIYGFAELRQRAMIELNDEVSLPPAGRVRIAGMTIAEAQAAIRRLVTARPLRQRFPDGRDSLIVIAAEDVNVAIAEYRPVYVMGDVAKPGELAFRPGLTARQAIALAGGFDIMRYRLVNPFTESADLKGRQESLWTEMAKARIEVARIRAELDGNQNLDRSALNDIPLDAPFLAEIFDTESKILERRLASFTKEQQYLKGLVRMGEQRTRTLAASIDNEEQGLQEDKKGYSELLKVDVRNSLPVLRMMDIKRNQVASSSRVYQARAQFEQAELTQAEAAQSLQRLESDRRTALLKDLQAASVRSNDLQVQLSANGEKLMYTSLLKSRLVRGPGAKPTIRVFRSGRSAREKIDAVEDTPLLPGDTIEIALKDEYSGEPGHDPKVARNAKGLDPVSVLER
ncbi:MAG: polysaccharide biosynthesis/export family protein [Rhizomicrobium sp.]